jgi:hypothetical protein
MLLRYDSEKPLRLQKCQDLYPPHNNNNNNNNNNKFLRVKGIISSLVIQ